MRIQVLQPTLKSVRIALIVVVILACNAFVGQAQSITSTNDVTSTSSVVRTYGSAGGYRTEVTSQTNGTLTQEDREQISVLTAQTFQHIVEAQRAIDVDNIVDARKELEMGSKAVKAVRAMLPSTTVHTKTTAPDGKVVYENMREPQEYRVPLFEGMLSTRRAAPIVETKPRAQDSVDSTGSYWIGSEAITEEAITDFEYLERQLERAANALTENQLEAASKALTLAQIRGVEFRYHKEDTPLAEVRDALWLAKRALEKNNRTQTQTSLQVAHQQLEIYRQLVPEVLRQDVTEMMTEVSELGARLQQEAVRPQNQATAVSRQPESSKQVNAVTQWWEQFNSWFKKRS